MPYYITSALTRHFLEAGHSPVILALTVQREVAARMTARPGHMSVLSISVQLYGAVERLARLKPGAFYPPPRVESAIVRITPHQTPLLAPGQRAAFFRMVRAGFSQKRKQLKNSLPAGLQVSSAHIQTALQSAQIDPTRRPETLSIEEWLALHHTLLAHRDV